MPLQQTFIPYKDSLIPYYYLYNYRPVSVGKDTMSLSLLKFKRGLRPDLTTWISSALEMLDGDIIPPGCIILRALHHDELFVREDTPTSLDRLGTALADQFHGHYHPRLLRKSLHTPSIKGLSKEQRAAELNGLYYIDSAYPLSAPLSLLIIDDVLTTGTTMKTIIDTLQPSYPQAHLVAFTLARAKFN